MVYCNNISIEMIVNSNENIVEQQPQKRSHANDWMSISKMIIIYIILTIPKYVPKYISIVFDIMSLTHF